MTKNSIKVEVFVFYPVIINIPHLRYKHNDREQKSFGSLWC